jgi:RNA polymerase sigma-70 factor (ECF subfamily)
MLGAATRTGAKRLRGLIHFFIFQNFCRKTALCLVFIYRAAGKEECGPLTTLEFNALVRQYQGLVYTVCHQLVPDEGDAQDLAQETFLAAWRAIDRCPPGYEKQWLARIASNKAKDYLRSAWVRRVNTPGDDILALEGAPPGSDPEQQVLDAMSEETLTGKILGMREPYRTPCRLMLLEGRTAAEAAALCGRPQKTVEAQIYRAKKMLAEQIRQERRSEDGIVS